MEAKAESFSERTERQREREGGVDNISEKDRERTALSVGLQVQYGEMMQKLIPSFL